MTVAALVALGSAGQAAAQGGFGPAELEINQVRDGFFMIRDENSGNINVFVSDDGVMLIDTKFARDYERYMALLRTVTDQPVRFVINTHMHGDHTGGNSLLEALGPDIIATDNARRRLAAAQATGLPNITFNDHMRLYFGERVMDLYWLGRGHTDGDLVIHLPEERMVLTGDLFAGYEPNIRLIDYGAGGSLKEWVATLEAVLALDFDTVIPGHSGPTDRAMMQQYLDENERMLELIGEMDASGRSPQEIQTAVTTEFGTMAFFVMGGVQAVIDELD